MTSDLLDVPESAVVSHSKEATVRDWILKRKIAHVKLGRRVFLRRKDLEEFIENGYVPARQANRKPVDAR